MKKTRVSRALGAGNKQRSWRLKPKLRRPAASPDGRSGRQATDDDHSSSNTPDGNPAD